MILKENVSLKGYNTFGVEANATYFVEIDSVQDLQSLLKKDEIKLLPKLILGEGSNLLFTKDFEGIVIKINIKGSEVIDEDDQNVYLKCGAGLNWHEFVQECIGNGYSGIENLSLIPGTVGAAPIQNIGAYGVELKDVFFALEAMEIETGTLTSFSTEECKFGYRYSIFKGELRNKYIIVSVTFKLKKVSEFILNYGALQETIKASGNKEVTIKAVSEAVIHIRKSKLPDPKIIGNAGSFFKNPTISKRHYKQLKNEYPEMPGYPVDDENVKVPAGWLIEKCGWKGKRFGDAGVHALQALVLVNYKDAKGHEILNLAMQIQESVKEKFNIEITPEVNII